MKIEVTRKFGLLVLSVFVVIALIGCQSGPPQISIEGAKAELSPATVGEAIVTMNIRNQGGPDMLMSVKTDIPDAKASFHIMQGERMVNADTVKIPAKSTMELKMGGSHIMIEDMPKNVTAGSQLNVKLIFQKSGAKQILLTLQGPASMPKGHEHHM